LAIGTDPIASRSKPFSKTTFGEMAEQHVAAMAPGWRNEKHEKQWRSTIKTYCHAISDLPVDVVATEHVLLVLQPIWQRVPETASRVRSRIEQVLDAAKAIAGLLPHGNSVMDHLEGVGPELPYQGPSLPFIAVPTTAGTGSEATKNAVLSLHGPDGFKKSFRHDLLVARYAVVDPALLATCPPGLIAANGMDALTQLLESCVSTRANPFVDALALSGLGYVREGLLDWYEGGDKAAEGRAGMAYAALLSGIPLAQVGLGSVHGLAAPLGAFFPVPHGVACGTLVATATAVNIEALKQRDPDNPALPKYAEIGRRFAMQKGLNGDDARAYLIDTLQQWEEQLDLPRLAACRIASADFPRIVADSRGSSMKTNPVVLTDAEITRILEERL